MSPEVAASIVDRAACPRCGAEAGERCSRKNGRTVTYPHQQRALADLFNPRPTP